MDPNLVFASGLLIPQKLFGQAYFRGLASIYSPCHYAISTGFSAWQRGIGLAEKGRIVSLSTISTPHRGSPVADLLLGHPTGLELPFSDFLAQFANANAQALVDLTTTEAPGFAEKDTVSGVNYFAYAGSGFVSALLFPTHVLIEGREGPNDGMVSVQSATWPEELAEPAWHSADHFAEIGYDLNRPDLTTAFDFDAAIASIVATATA